MIIKKSEYYENNCGLNHDSLFNPLPWYSCSKCLACYMCIDNNDYEEKEDCESDYSCNGSEEKYIEQFSDDDNDDEEEEECSDNDDDEEEECSDDDEEEYDFEEDNDEEYEENIIIERKQILDQKEKRYVCSELGEIKGDFNVFCINLRNKKLDDIDIFFLCKYLNCVFSTKSGVAIEINLKNNENITKNGIELLRNTISKIKFSKLKISLTKYQFPWRCLEKLSNEA